MSKVKLMKHYAQNTETGIKARCWYSRGNLITLGDAVTVYAKSYSDRLYPIFGESVENDTDTQTDYFEKDRVRILPGSPLWERACELATR